MARVVRQTPQAINKPLQVLGVRGWTVSLCLLLGFMLCHWSAKAAAVAFLGLTLSARYAESKDTNYFNTLRTAMRFKRVYDPLKRSAFRTVIE